MKTNKILILNPRSSTSKHRIPNSILQVGASIHGKYEYVFVDGNMELDAWKTINEYFETGTFKYFCSTVMPGPQLKQAIPFSRKIKRQFPDSIVIWGGYFASNQYKSSLNSGYVDYIVNGPGDNTFPSLINHLETDPSSDFKNIKNLIYKDNDTIVITPKETLIDQDTLPALPYDYLNTFYSLENYLGKTFLGNRTFSYHSSVGCPFTCSFCAVVPIYNARWKGKSAHKMYEDISYFKKHYNIDAIEFHDNNFFTSRKRVIEFSKLIENDGISWWGEGRIDTINQYSDEDLILMRKAGCKMIFLGAETGNDEILKQMDKGGKQSGQMIKDFAVRMQQIGIIPEMSFVLGMPAESPTKVMQQIDWDINFIKEIKTLNPNTEIIIYLYSPVPTEGSELYKQIISSGFSFPKNLEDWILPSWENFDLRKNPLTPWLTSDMVDKIKDFETVLNGYYPTVSDFRVTGLKKKLITLIASVRYKSGFYAFPYEIKALQKIWKYRQPEVEGFHME